MAETEHIFTFQIEDPTGAIENKSITADTVIIGRDPDFSNLVLEDERISKQHAKIEYDGKNYLLTDMGSLNYTYLDGVRLSPNVQKIWHLNQMVRICEHILRLMRPTPSPAQPERVVIELTQANIRVEPGKKIVFPLVLHNPSTGQVDTFYVEIEGIPREWWDVQPSNATILGGGRHTFTVTIAPPDDWSSYAQNYPLVVWVVSDNSKQRIHSAKLILDVMPFYKFSCQLEPETVLAHQAVQIDIMNQSNAKQTFDLLFDPKDHALTFAPSKPTLTLKPGECETVKVYILPKKTYWLGRDVKSHSFLIQILSREGQNKSPLPGHVLNKPRLPYQFLILSALVTLFLFGVFLFLSIPNIVNPTICSPQPELGKVVSGAPIEICWDAVEHATSVEVIINGHPTKILEPELKAKRYKSFEEITEPATIEIQANNWLGEHKVLLFFGRYTTPLPVAFVSPTPTPAPTPLAPVIVKFVAQRTRFIKGEENAAMRFEWTVENTVKVSINNDDGKTIFEKEVISGTAYIGDQVVPTKPTTYTLVAENQSGHYVISKPLFIDVIVPTCQVITTDNPIRPENAERSYHEVYELPAGTQLEVVARHISNEGSDWLKVNASQIGRAGWVKYRHDTIFYLQCNVSLSDIDRLPSTNVTPIPSPTPTQIPIPPPPTPVLVPPTPPVSYTFCAKEKERCTFSGTKDIRYGANGIFIYKEGVMDGIDCTNEAFDGDPIRGVGKTCEIKN